MSIIKSNLKKTFKIVLNCIQTASWTGKQFDAFYIIDLSKILTDPEDYNKAYSMTFALGVGRLNALVTFVAPSTSFSLAIDLCKGFNTVSNLQQYNIVGFIPISNDYTLYSSASGLCPSVLDAKCPDNEPILYRDIKGLTTIRLTMINNNTGIMFNPTDSSTINAISPYVCILTFKQL